MLPLIWQEIKNRRITKNKMKIEIPRCKRNKGRLYPQGIRLVTLNRALVTLNRAFSAALKVTGTEAEPKACPRLESNTTLRLKLGSRKDRPSM